MGAVKVQMTTCQSKIMRFVFESVSFLVTVAVNVQADVHWLIKALEKAKSGMMRRLSKQVFNVLSRLAKNFYSAMRRSSWQKAGVILYDIFYQLWQSDIIMLIINKAKDAMTPWDWFTTGASLLATLTMWATSGGLACAAAVANAVMRAGNLIQAGNMVRWYC